MLSACSKLTTANYERISLGTSFDDVQGMLGTPTQCNDTLAMRACVWGDAARNIRVSFVAGKAVLFSAHNLE